MKLLPLEQFVCDTCGAVIRRAEDGYVQFRQDADGRCFDFIVVHQRSVSPRGPHRDCYQHEYDMDLEFFLGPAGINHLLSLVDPQSNSTADMASWVELFRRLHLPYYEEARLYFAQASADDSFEGDSSWFHLDELREIVRQYRDRD